MRYIYYGSDDYLCHSKKSIEKNVGGLFKKASYNYKIGTNGRFNDQVVVTGDSKGLKNERRQNMRNARSAAIKNSQYNPQADQNAAREWKKHKWVGRKRGRDGKWIYDYGNGFPDEIEASNRKRVLSERASKRTKKPSKASLLDRVRSTGVRWVASFKR